MIITVQLTYLEDNKGEYALEDFVVKRECERKGITKRFRSSRTKRGRYAYGLVY